MSAGPANPDAVRVRDVLAVLEDRYPSHLAESWDTGIGLTAGDPDAAVEQVHFAVDVTPEVVAEAVAAGADLLLTHHPLLFSGVQSVAADTVTGSVLQTAIRAELALVAVHTNADSARPGVSDALAEALGMTVTEPLAPASSARLDTLVTYVPIDGGGPLDGNVARVVDALAAAGAGQIGDYSRCAYAGAGEGTFLPGSGAQPAIGHLGSIERVRETRIEMVLPRERRRAVLAALRSAHPYEEPAFHFVAHDNPREPGRGAEFTACGLGRVGDLAASVTLAQLAERAAGALPVGSAGVRFAGDPHAVVRRLAVCGGAGDSLIGAAVAAGADAYLTADLRHHVTSEAAAGALAGILDAGHWATEWPWLPVAARLLENDLRRRGLRGVRTSVSRLVTDPWTGIATKGVENIES